MYTDTMTTDEAVREAVAYVNIQWRAGLVADIDRLRLIRTILKAAGHGSR